MRREEAEESGAPASGWLTRGGCDGSAGAGLARGVIRP